jgi:hypothetical protein
LLSTLVVRHDQNKNQPIEADVLALPKIMQGTKIALRSRVEVLTLPYHPNNQYSSQLEFVRAGQLLRTTETTKDDLQTALAA